MVQWLRLLAPNARGPGSIPDQGAGSHMPQLKVPRAATETWHSQINKFFFLKSNNQWSEAPPPHTLVLSPEGQPAPGASLVASALSYPHGCPRNDPYGSGRDCILKGSVRDGANIWDPGLAATRAHSVPLLPTLPPPHFRATAD